MDEKNRRLIQGDDIIYPFTRQENVIGLQKTIKEKLPIVSSETPDNYVERQVWLDTSEQIEESNVAQQLMLNSPNVEEEVVSYQLEQPEEIISTQLQNEDNSEISSQLEQQEIISTQLEESMPSTQLEEQDDNIVSTVLEN